ncbi:hypothetical protein GCM10009083_23690 [Halopseudomonas pertucinogena]|uniref:Uncharacterized protein n=1 Tax=Halopseudomonas pertucinogena TaxID=86175 RepID=A0ABQ2CVG2_9GAMM|nr:hypothetical protein GCM10009083_23690 [Halopseudomonas pertucinogena]
MAYRSMKVASACSGGGLINALGLGALEGAVDIGIGQQQSADGAVTGQFRPAGGLVDLLAHGGGPAAGGHVGLHQTEGGANLMGSAHHDLVDHHDGHGGTGYRIHGDGAGVTGAPDHHPLVGADAVIQGVEVMQALFGNADQQNRLVVLQHIGVLNHALGIHQDQHVHRLAGVGRDIDDVDALEGVAVNGAHAVSQCAYAVVSFRLGNHRRTGEELLDTLFDKGLIGEGGREE